MPTLKLDAETITELKQQKTEINRLVAAVTKSDARVTALCEKLSHAQELLHSERDALADARHQFNELLAGVSPAIQDLLRQPGADASVAAGPSTPSAPLGPREKTQWVYSKLRRRARSQAELCEIYSVEFGKPAQSLLAFLVASKYFRKTGTPGDFSWSISTNRENDLREYLA